MWSLLQSITFVHAGLLVLLPLAAIPILLHLLTLQRLRTVELSTYRFLFDSYVQQRRRTQFLEALLAFLRTLFVLLLILAVMRPVVQQTNALFDQGKAGAGRQVLLLIDCSASMDRVSAGESSLDRAKKAAKAVAEQLSADDRVTLVRVAGKPEIVFKSFTPTAAGIAARIDQLRTSPTRANLFAALMALFGPEAEPLANPVVYFFTDAQTSSFYEFRSAGSAKLGEFRIDDRSRQELQKYLPEQLPVVFVRTGVQETDANVAVVGLAPGREPAIVGLPISLTARVINYSSNRQEATVRLFLGEKEVGEARRIVTLPARKEGANDHIVDVRFPPLTLQEPGLLRAAYRVSLNQGGSDSRDAFPADNEYLFTLHVRPRVKVLLVNGQPSPDPLENETLFLRAALSVIPRSASGPEPKSPPAETNPGNAKLAQALDIEDIAEAQLTERKIREASVIVLANCGQLNATHFGWLRDYVADGGGLLIFPGDRVQPQVYNTQFFPQPPPQKDKLIGLELAPAVGDPENEVTFRRLRIDSLTHPVFSVFDTDDDQKYFERVAIKRHFPLTAGKGKDNVAAEVLPLLRYSDGSPALVEGRFGEGSVILASFPVNAKWTNFPSNGVEFVPMMLRLVTHAQRRAEAEGPIVVPAGAVARFSVSGSWAPVQGEVTVPGDAGLTAIRFERAGIREVGVFEKTDERGYYAVELRSLRDSGKMASLAFAVNLTAEEAEIATLAEPKIQECLPSTRLTFFDGFVSAADPPVTPKQRDEYWRPLIWILFVIIISEFTLATLRGSKGPDEQEPTLSERLASYSPTSWVGRMTGAKKSS